jgi:hypothetical protein
MTVFPFVVAPILMLRPTRSRVVTEIDIVLALAKCNMTKIKSSNVQFVGIPVFAAKQAAADWLTLEPLRRLRRWAGFAAECCGRVARL